MRELINVKLWTERKALSRSRWDDGSWEGRYSVTWGNRSGWREEKRKLSRLQRRIMMAYQMQK